MEKPKTQTIVTLTPQVIEELRKQTGQEWKDCQRKEYAVYACKPPAGYLYANKLEQPDSYDAICEANGGNPIISEKEVSAHPGLFGFLKVNGFYQTDGNRVVLCGTQGELWDVKPEKLAQSYRMPDGKEIVNISEDWFTVSRAAEDTPSAVAIQLPVEYMGRYQTSWGSLLEVNHPNSTGHGKGDILVAPKLPDGTPDYENISPTNNAVFALTYHQNVGGWDNSDRIMPAGEIKSLAIDEVRERYCFSDGGRSVEGTEPEELPGNDIEGEI